jgi:hypothetical protein
MPCASNDKKVGIARPRDLDELLGRAALRNRKRDGAGDGPALQLPNRRALHAAVMERFAAILVQGFANRRWKPGEPILN